MDAQVSKTMQDFVRINVQPGIMQKVPELREAFGSSFRQHFSIRLGLGLGLHYDTYV